jgi:hypothetical protein
LIAFASGGRCSASIFSTSPTALVSAASSSRPPRQHLREAQPARGTEEIVQLRRQRLLEVLAVRERERADQPLEVPELLGELHDLRVEVAAVLLVADLRLFLVVDRLRLLHQLRAADRELAVAVAVALALRVVRDVDRVGDLGGLELEAGIVERLVGEEEAVEHELGRAELDRHVVGRRLRPLVARPLEAARAVQLQQLEGGVGAERLDAPLVLDRQRLDDPHELGVPGLRALRRFRQLQGRRRLGGRILRERGGEQHACDEVHATVLSGFAFGAPAAGGGGAAARWFSAFTWRSSFAPKWSSSPSAIT